MSDWSPPQKRLIRVLLLGAVLVLALLLASLPRWNYAYPVHSDEWVHYSDARSLMATTRIPYPEPGEAGQAFAPDTEIGFHLWLAELKHVTGLSWLAMFRIIPGIVLAILAWQVYALARRKWVGLTGAFLVVLMPTTIRFLGPAFLVPVGLGLTFLPVTLLIVRRLMHDPRGPVLLAASLFALLFIHPPSFIIATLFTAVHLVFYLIPGNKPLSRPLFAAVALGAIAAMYLFEIFWASDYIRFNLNEALTPQSEQLLPPITDIISKFGYVLPFLFAAGTGILAYRGTRKNWALLLPAVSLLAFQLLYSFSFIGPDIIYERGWLYLYLFMAIIGGMALGDIRRWLEQFFRRWAGLAAAVSYGAIGVLLVTNFAFSLRSHLTEPYYHLVDDVTYQDFLWVREHVTPRYQTGIADMGLNCPFAAVSGKNVYTSEVSRHFRSKEPPATEFLTNGATDTRWLLEEGISIVYTGQPVVNDHLNKVNRNLYLLIAGAGD
jgi:hypothetical protein